MSKMNQWTNCYLPNRRGMIFSPLLLPASNNTARITYNTDTCIHSTSVIRCTTGKLSRNCDDAGWSLANVGSIDTGMLEGNASIYNDYRTGWHCKPALVLEPALHISHGYQLFNLSFTSPIQ